MAEVTEKTETFDDLKQDALVYLIESLMDTVPTCRRELNACGETRVVDRLGEARTLHTQGDN